jgi:hypothetical protein
MSAARWLPRLVALRLDVEGRDDVARDRPLSLTFTTAVDPRSVGLDTVQVRRGAPADPLAPSSAPPVLGRYEVRRNRVSFHPHREPRRPVPPRPPGRVNRSLAPFRR